MKGRIEVHCDKGCGTSITVIEGTDLSEVWVCTQCRTKGRIVAELFPSVDPFLPRYIDQRTPDDHTLTWWRERDYFRHPFLTVPLTLFPTTKNLRGKLRIQDKATHLALEMTGQGHEPFDKMAEWALSNVEERDLILVPADDDSPEKSRTQFYRVDNTMGSVLAPIRGTTLPEMERWVETIEAPDGYHVTPHNDLGAILSAFIIHEEFFPKARLHIRGVSGKRAIELVGMLTRSVQSPISFETGSHLAGITAGVYYRPFTVRELVRLLKGTELENNPCDCPVCARQFDFGGLGERLPTRTVPTTLHNLYQYLRFLRLCQSTERTELAVAKSHGATDYVSAEVYRLNDVFGYYKAHGWEAVREHSTAFGEDFDTAQARLFETVPSADPPPCAICEQGKGSFPLDTMAGGVLICDDCRRFYEEARKVLS